MVRDKPVFVLLRILPTGRVREGIHLAILQEIGGDFGLTRGFLATLPDAPKTKLVWILLLAHLVEDLPEDVLVGAVALLRDGIIHPFDHIGEERLHLQGLPSGR